MNFSTGIPGPPNGGSINYPKPRTEVSVMPAQPISTINPWATVRPDGWFNNHNAKKMGGIAPPIVRTRDSRSSRR